MNRTYSFKDIATFCESTGDINTIHDGPYMEKYSKLPIVPGLMILTESLLDSQKYFNQTNRIEIIFENILGPGQNVDFQHRLNSQDPLEILLTAQNKTIGSDQNQLFNSKKRHTKLLKREIKKPNIPSDITLLNNLHQPNFKSFLKLYEPHSQNNLAIMPLLYLMACSSGVLFRGAHNPKNDEERALKKLITTEDRILPVYKIMEFNIFKTYILHSEIKDINYWITWPENSAKKSMTKVDIICEKDQKIIYTAKFTLFKVKEEEIIKTAYDL